MVTSTLTLILLYQILQLKNLKEPRKTELPMVYIQTLSYETRLKVIFRET
jgi:hypothetical protein